MQTGIQANTSIVETKHNHNFYILVSILFYVIKACSHLHKMLGSGDMKQQSHWIKQQK